MQARQAIRAARGHPYYAPYLYILRKLSAANLVNCAKEAIVSLEAAHDDLVTTSAVRCT